MKLRKSLRSLIVMAIIIIVGFSIFGLCGQTVATDNDGDGLDDDWEGKHGYDNGTKAEKIIVYEEKDDWDKEEKSDDLINTFLFVLLLSFGIFSFLAGIFTAYFGAGKSRAIGAFLLVIGLVIILIWVYFGVLQDFPNDSIIGYLHWEAAKTLEAFLTVLAAIIGAGLAIVMFLVAIMKS